MPSLIEIHLVLVVLIDSRILPRLAVSMMLEVSRFLDFWRDAYVQLQTEVLRIRLCHGASLLRYLHLMRDAKPFTLDEWIPITGLWLDIQYDRLVKWQALPRMR